MGTILLHMVSAKVSLYVCQLVHFNCNSSHCAYMHGIALVLLSLLHSTIALSNLMNNMFHSLHQKELGLSPCGTITGLSQVHIMPSTSQVNIVDKCQGTVKDLNTVIGS